MANLKDIKRRIGSVKSTQKITNAMKLVSAAKFARASHAAEAARPYARALDQLVGKLLAGQTEFACPLLRDSDEKRILILMLATDRGLCGGLNANLWKATQQFVNDKSKQGVTCDLFACGRKAMSFGRKLKLNMVRQIEKILEKGNVDTARALAKSLSELFTEVTYEKIYIAYPYYRSALDQTASVEQLLPVPLGSQHATAVGQAEAANLIVEPNVEELLDHLLERKLVSSVFTALLSAVASEHGARMTAMDSATNNAKEVIRKLTLQYNRARQAAITKELIEIISGAEAL